MDLAQDGTVRHLDWMTSLIGQHALSISHINILLIYDGEKGNSI